MATVVSNLCLKREDVVRGIQSVATLLLGATQFHTTGGHSFYCRWKTRSHAVSMTSSTAIASGGRMAAGDLVASLQSADKKT